VHNINSRHISIGVFLVWAISCSTGVWGDGAELYRVECSHCHGLSQNAATTVGPPLINIVKASAAAPAGFTYSEALQQAATAGLVWDAERLGQFLAAPTAYIDGTTMAYQGLADVQDRNTLITWLAETPTQTLAELSEALEVSNDPDVVRIQSMSGDSDYGEYLASECVTCHGGGAAGVPPITGLGSTYFISALLAYKSGERTNAVMQLMAENLGDEELAALAAFFTHQQP